MKWINIVTEGWKTGDSRDKFRLVLMFIGPVVGLTCLAIWFVRFYNHFHG
jgi:hypothetical protein